MAVEEEPGAVEPIGTGSLSGGNPAPTTAAESVDVALVLLEERSYWGKVYSGRKNDVEIPDGKSSARLWLDEHRDQPGDEDPRTHVARVFHATVLCGDPEEIRPLCTDRGFREREKIITEDFNSFWIFSSLSIAESAVDSFTAVIAYNGLWTVIPSEGPPHTHAIRFVKEGDVWKADAVEVLPGDTRGLDHLPADVQRRLIGLEEPPG